ncbi:hypothetical protein Nepgr_000874 [Nepenthes gracilis]|uniref:Pentatricopeptide repeat-containing protein n=1 Tax=Nepenthes gracilis TaxID=150966 RepID=A0AAD3P552_NEPGR|nr:hypothetical protein Nepgr_000874 [Nepenthes gracilis]
MHRYPRFLSLIFIRSLSISNLEDHKSTVRLFSSHSLLHTSTQFRNSVPQSSQSLFSPTDRNSNANPNFRENDFTALCALLTDPNILPGPDLENALEETGIEPSPSLLEAIFKHLDSSPKPLFSLFRWANKQPDYKHSAPILNSMINILAKSREFDLAWMVLLDFIDLDDELKLVSADSFAILIRRYARVDLIKSSGLETDLFEVLLDALCKEGQIRAASEYIDRKMNSESDWVPSIRVYNILLNGWFRVRKLKRVEQLWTQMRKENVMPTVVTYGTLIEGYSRMRYVERAIELVGEMRREGIEPNAVVYNSIVDALAEGGRFKEALGMLERFLVLESGPTLSTYNSLVKGFCKAGDLVGASKILKMMTSRGFVPTSMTYNYFFRYFSKHRKIEEGMNLYTKMIDAGYNPTRLTFHLMIKMLCELERLDLAVQVSREMRARGCDMDLATSTMLVHLLCKMHRLEEAFAEFENMIRKGIVPQYLTYQRISHELAKRGMFKIKQKLSNMMASLPHSTKLPNTYSGDEDTSHLKRKSIMRRAKEMSDILKKCNDPRELVKGRGFPENAVSTANQLIDEIKRRFSDS